MREEDNESKTEMTMAMNIRANLWSVPGSPNA